jgi:hypothetical protein
MLKKTATGSWCFLSGKHKDKTLDEVARESPEYLQWVRRKGSLALSDEAFYALEDVMLAHRIDLS